MNTLLGKLSGALFFLLAFAFSSFAQAPDFESYSAQFTIVKDTVLVEEIFIFPSPQISFSWILPSDAEAVEVSPGTFQIQTKEEQQKIMVTGNFTTLSIKYLTGSLIEKTQDRFFLVDLSKVHSKEISVTLILSEGATLKYSLDSPQISVVPKTSKISTDGKSIVLQWDEMDLAQGKAMMVIYTEAKTVFGIEKMVLLLALLILFFVGKKQVRRLMKEKEREELHREEKYVIGEGKKELFSEEKKEEKKTEDNLKKELTKNLFEEERALIEVLLEAKGHELWQKQLQLQTGISAVKLSRKLRNLEAKGLIEKIPYGNTNKIRVRVHE